jgi:hypothetical protein
VDPEQRKEALRSIAAINLKKISGGHTAHGGDVRVIAREDKDLIKEQIEIYDADIVICCGTGDIFHEIMKLSGWESTSRGIDFVEYRSGKYVIRYFHPEARVCAQIIYYSLIDAIREIKCRRQD